jgi:hypothetical protein
MKNILLFIALTLVTFSARAENNGLVVDAQARGYSINLTDVAFGSSGLTLFNPGVRVVVNNITKDGKPVRVEDFNGTADQGRRLRAQFTEICKGMFGTEERLKSYDVEGVDYAYFPGSDGKEYLNTLGCLFSQRSN